MLVKILEHINLVRNYIRVFTNDLSLRASLHDLSKLRPPEFEIFSGLEHELSNLKYGTPEYDVSKKKLGEALVHHYQNNRHHPEHYEGGINDMALGDIIEMFCDWKAASMRVKDGNFEQSLLINKERFGMSHQLYAILENTRKLLGW